MSQRISSENVICIPLACKLKMELMLYSKVGGVCVREFLYRM